jgi:N utilization substance protein B
MGSNNSSRHRAREFAVQGLYQFLVGGQDTAAIQVQAESVAGFHKADNALYLRLLHEAIDNIATLHADITPHVSRPWEEISPIERSVLLLGACEFRFHPETPYRVIINECVELTKTFGGTDGHKFVNGVLDKMAAVLRTVETAAH